MEFINSATKSKYVIQDGTIKWYDTKKDKLQEIIFIDRIDWLWILSDKSAFMLINKLELHFGNQQVDIIAESYEQAHQMADVILEEKKKLQN